jgi:hypothetical protein
MLRRCHLSNDWAQHFPLLRPNPDRSGRGWQYTHDALDGHSRAIILPGRLQSKVAIIQRCTPWRAFMRTLMLGHLCLLCFEPVCVCVPSPLVLGVGLHLALTTNEC